jgi:hypothetical protein
MAVATQGVVVLDRLLQLAISTRAGCFGLLGQAITWVPWCGKLGFWAFCGGGILC